MYARIYWVDTWISLTITDWRAAFGASLHKGFFLKKTLRKRNPNPEQLSQAKAKVKPKYPEHSVWRAALEPTLQMKCLAIKFTPVKISCQMKIPCDLFLPAGIKPET